MAGIRIIWEGKRFNARVQDALFAGLRKGVDFARGEIVRRISRSSRVGGSGVRHPQKGAGSPMQFQHSKPGEPPRRDTGKLAQSIFGKESREIMEGFVGTTLKYGAMLERGTRPHTIRPKRKKMLAFGIGGKWVFSRGVAHPGTAKRPYLLSTIVMRRELINAIIIGTAKSILRRTSTVSKATSGKRFGLK